MTERQLTASIKRWPLAQPFVIARGSKTHVDVVEVTIREKGAQGHGEGVPYPRYGESPEGVIEQIRSLRGEIAAGMDRQSLRHALHAGAARNALDCALWDLEAKASGTPVWQLAGLAHPKPVVTAFTLSIRSAAQMAEEAKIHRERPLLKVKLAGDGLDVDRLQAVHRAAPRASLWADANEGLRPKDLQSLMPKLDTLGVTLLEQPLPSGEDAQLFDRSHRTHVCADESFTGDLDGLESLSEGYTHVNVKLDKTGGLTAAIDVVRAATAKGLRIAVGCMCSSSLSIAPAVLLAQEADYVDLDGAWLLAKDRSPAITYDSALIHPAPPALWG